MPKSDRLPTDYRFPAFRAHKEAEYGGRLPDALFYAGEGEKWAREPYHTEVATEFRLFAAGWEAACNAAQTDRWAEELRHRTEASPNPVSHEGEA